jgi:quinol monooxygenase YgiN
VETLLLEMMAAVRGSEPGCLLYRPTRSPSDGDMFVLYEEYRDQEAFDAHMLTPHFSRLIEGKVTPLLLQRDRELMVPIA